MNKRKSHLLKILAITIILLFMEIVLSLNTIIAEEVEFEIDGKTYSYDSTENCVYFYNKDKDKRIRCPLKSINNKLVYYPEYDEGTATYAIYKKGKDGKYKDTRLTIEGLVTYMELDDSQIAAFSALTSEGLSQNDVEKATGTKINKSDTQEKGKKVEGEKVSKDYPKYSYDSSSKKLSVTYYNPINNEIVTKLYTYTKDTNSFNMDNPEGNGQIYYEDFINNDDHNSKHKVMTYISMDDLEKVTGISKDSVDSYMKSSDEAEGEGDDTERNIAETLGDGILGILLLGAKLLILLIGRIFSLILGFFTDNGASLSVQDIIFNKVKITDINFFDIDGADGVIKTIRENVAAWYVGVRNLASVVLVIILIYVGIRMAISTIAEEKAKYKKMLIDWFTSMCLLFVLHFIIILTIQLNNTLVGAIGDASSTGDIAKQFLDNALNNVYLTKGMGNAICYLLLEAITFGFLIAYIKRMITIAFLIIIAPLVTITYSIDRMGDGSSQALNTWFKEFAYNILIQPFHCIAFLALCSTAVNLGEKANLGDATLAICLLAFLAKSAEDIVKRIFGFQAQSMASPVAAAALGYTLAQNTAKFTQKLRSSANGKAPKIPQDNNENGSASTTTPSRASQNNIQVANSNQQNANNNIANANNTANAINTNNTNNTTPTTANMPSPQIKQRKLTGQGIGGKVIRGFARGVINANKYALTMGTGLALGASQGDLGKALAGTSFGLEIGQGWASNTAEKISGSHHRANTAKAFNNYKAKTGMSDEEISKRAMSLLKGDVEPENDNDKELKSALIDMTNYYRAEGSNEEESYKRTNQVLKDITSGAQGEETATSRFTGHIKEKYYKQQAKSYRKKSLDTANYTQAERDEFKRKSEEAKQFIKDKYAREDFTNRKK